MVASKLKEGYNFVCEEILRELNNLSIKNITNFKGLPSKDRQPIMQLVESVDSTTVNMYQCYCSRCKSSSCEIDTYTWFVVPACCMCKNVVFYELTETLARTEAIYYIVNNIVLTQNDYVRLYCLFNSPHLYNEDTIKLCKKFLPNIYNLYKLIF